MYPKLINNEVDYVIEQAIKKDNKIRDIRLLSTYIKNKHATTLLS